MSQFAKMELSLLTQSCICGVDHRCALVKKPFPIQPGGVALVHSPPHSPGLPAPPTIPPCTASEWKHLKISFLLSLWSRRCLQAPHAPGGSLCPGLLSRGTASASCPRSRPARCTPAWPQLRPHLCSSRPSQFHRFLQGKQRERWLRNLRLLYPQTCQQWRRRPLAYQGQGEPVAPFSTAAAVRRGLFPLSHFLLLQTAFEGLLVCSRSTPSANACHTGWGLAPFRRNQADPPLPSLKLNPSASHQVTRTIMSQSHQHKSWPGHTEILSFIALPLQPKPWGRQGRELVRSYFLSLNLCSSDMHLLTKWMSYQTSKHISGMCGFICVGDAPACVVTQWEGPLKTAFWEDWFGAGLEAAQLYLPCHAPQSHALGPYGRCLHLAEHDMAWDKDQDNGFSRDETEALQGEGAQGLLCKWSLQVLPLTYPASRVSRQCARRAVTETSAHQWYCNSIGLIVTAKWLCAGAVQVKIPVDPSTFTSCHHKQNRLQDWSLTPTKVTVPVSTSLIKVQKARHFSVPN